MVEGLPLVSCLMVTQFVPERLKMLQRSVTSYLSQTYGRRELVLVANDGPEELTSQTEAYLSGLARKDIRLVRLPGNRTLGELRNQTLDLAKGEIVCQWDDDDLSHPTRIEMQLKALVTAKRGAVCLRYVAHLFTATHQAVLTDWSRSRHLCHPATIMAVREKAGRYPEAGPNALRNEDAMFLTHFRQSGELGILSNDPYLFTYVCHGTNTWAVDHHQMLARKCGMSRPELDEVQDSLQAQMGYAYEALGNFEFVDKSDIS